MIGCVLIALLSIGYFLYYTFCFKRRALPPGPCPLPFVGNTMQLGDGKKSRYQMFQEWRNKYGPVYTLWFGERPTVILADLDVIRASVIRDGDAYTGRHFLNTHFRLFFGSVDGVIRTEGEQWKQLRKFLLRSMRDYGQEGASTEKLVLDAIFAVINGVKMEIDAGQQEHSIDQKVDLMTGSVINQMLIGYPLYGERYKEFVFLKDMLDVVQEYFASLPALLIEQTPWLRHLPYLSGKFAHAKRACEQLFAYAQREIDQRVAKRQQQHRVDGIDGSNAVADEQRTDGKRWRGGDMLDQFLDQIERTDQTEANNYFKVKYLCAFIFDAFLAGQETTSNTLNFLILFMMLDQDAQHRLHTELDRVMAEKMRSGENDEEKMPSNGVGGEEDKVVDGIGVKEEEQAAPFLGIGRTPLAFRQSDRTKLNYTNAVVNETQRLCNLLPINLDRRVTKDVEIAGYKLPEGSTLIPQVATVLYDEKLFPQPLKFMPERFLDENGQLKKCEELVPFGYGKRICPGEALAKMELFLFTANFFHKFHIYPPNPLDPPKFEKRHTFAVKLPPYTCLVVIRR